MEIKEIIKKEPLLLNIFNEAKTVKGTYWERNDYWYKKLKPKINQLVGFQSKNKDLVSCKIYDIVYFYCMDLMSL